MWAGWLAGFERVLKRFYCAFHSSKGVPLCGLRLPLLLVDLLERTPVAPPASVLVVGSLASCRGDDDGSPLSSP